MFEIEPEFKNERRILGLELKLIRISMGMTQAQFLKLLKDRRDIEFTQGYWSAVENGQKRLPFIQEFEVMEALDLTLQEVKQLRAIRRKFSPSRFQ